MSWPALSRWASVLPGAGGVLMAALLGHVRRKMLRVGLPAVLDTVP